MWCILIITGWINYEEIILHNCVAIQYMFTKTVKHVNFARKKINHHDSFDIAHMNTVFVLEYFHTVYHCICNLR